VEIGLYIAPQQGATYDDQLAAARLAERLGYDAFVRSDHYRAFTGTGLPGPTDTWVTLAALGRETSSIRLGAMVSAAMFRLPGPLAIVVAQADAMSGGRMMLGLGTGWDEQEHRAYGIPFPPLAERFARLDEQLAIITGIWATATGGTFAFSGRYYTLESCPALPKPVQQPHPPIIVGGSGARVTPSLAARYADEFNLPPPFDGADAARAAFARARAACEAHHRDPATLSLSVTVTTVCGDDKSEVERRADRGRATGVPDVMGTPEQVCEQLARYAGAGASRAYLRIPDLHDLEHIELLGASVVGAMKEPATPREP
jgi:F420-dependent oxidoreductase-like protein